MNTKTSSEVNYIYRGFDTTDVGAAVTEGIGRALAAASGLTNARVTDINLQTYQSYGCLDLGEPLVPYIRLTVVGD